MNYTLEPDTLKRAHRALQAAIIKAALDGRWADKRGMETSLADIKAAMVGDLSPRPHTVVCHLTVEELTDIELAVEDRMKRFETHGDNSALMIARRLRVIADRLHVTLKLNRPIGKEAS